MVSGSQLCSARAVTRHSEHYIYIIAILSNIRNVASDSPVFGLDSIGPIFLINVGYYFNDNRLFR